MKSLPVFTLTAVVTAWSTLGVARTGAATLDVDATFGNSPYTVAATASYTALTVGDTSTGALSDSGYTLTVGTGTILVGNAAGSTGTYTLTGTGGLTDTTTFMYVGYSGTGTVSQSGSSAVNLGTDALYLGENTTGVGTYNLGGSATLTSSTVYVGFGASSLGNAFNITGGTLSLSTHSLDIAYGTGSTASFMMSSGAANLYSVFVGYGGTGTATVSGGTITAGSSISVGYSGSTAIGTFGISGGTVSTAVNLYDGYNGTGTINLTGGTFSVTGNVDLAHLAASAMGTLNVGPGAILNTTATTSQFNIGEVGTGTLNQTGGTITLAGTTTAVAVVGRNGGAIGMVTLSGGTLNASAGGFDVGSSGTGTVTQTGGTLNAGTTGVAIGVVSGGVGTYTLSTGGTLSTGSVTGGAGTSTFNLNGGSLQAAMSTTTFLQGLTTANVQSGGAKINTNTFNVTVAQILLHDTTSGAAAVDGGLTKTGTGTLTLTGANTYTGPTNVSAGTLLLSTGSLNNSASVSVTGTGALTLGNATSLSDTVFLSLVSGTTLNLSAGSGSESIGGLMLDSRTIAPGTYTAAQLTALDAAVTFTSTGETLTVVPEPGTWWVGLLTLGALAHFLRRLFQSNPLNTSVSYE